MTTFALLRKNFFVQFLSTSLTIVGMVILPIFVHLIPFSGNYPLGAYLLPMFIAPLVAAFYFSPIGVILAVAVGPLLNNLLTGMPQAPEFYFLTFELGIFAVLVSQSIRKEKLFFGFSVGAILVAKLVMIIPRIYIINGSLDFSSIVHSLNSLVIAIPGILALLIIERLLAR